MSKDIGKVERKHKSRVGAFIFGWFMCFIFNLALLLGVGAFVYFKVSPSWINNTFHTNINLGSEEVNNKTLKDFVDSAINLAKNVNTYTLNDHKKDFGISVNSEYFGINIEDLKSVGLRDLPNALKDKFSSVSAYELRDLVDLSSMSDIMESTVKYYVNDGRLYKDDSSSTEVDFDYSISGNVVTIKGENYTANGSGIITPQVQKLPLVNGSIDYLDSLGENMTIGELQDEYHITLPTYLAKEEYKTRKVTELESIINNLKIADILELTYSGGVWKDKSNNTVSSFVGAIADLKVSEVSSQIETKIKNLTVADVFDASSMGALSVIDDDTKLSEIPTALKDAISGENALSLYELREKGMIDSTTNLSKQVFYEGEFKDLGELNLNEIIDYVALLP